MINNKHENTGAVETRHPTWLFVIPWGIEHAGGVNQVVINLFRECIHDGRFRPLVLALDWSASTPRYSSHLGCDIVSLRVRAPGSSIREVAKWVLSAPIELFRLFRLLVREEVGVVNWHYPTAAIFSIAVLRRLGLFRGQVILSFHGKDLSSVSFQSLVNTITWRIISGTTDAITACSANLAVAVRHVFFGRRVEIKIVHNGIDVEAARTEAISTAPPSELEAVQEYLLNIATYEHKKGQDILIRAFLEISAEFPTVKLVMMGRDDGVRAKLSKLTADLGLTDRVLLLAAQPHGRALAACRGALVFVLPSRFEPFGLVVLEAATACIPVIATRVGGIPEIIEHGVSGLLVEPEDVQCLAEALRMLLGGPELRDRLAKALLRRVKEHFAATKSFVRLSEIVRPDPRNV